MNHEYEWDNAKDLANQQKHGIRFDDAALAFSGNMLVRKDDRFDYGEDRFLGIGLLDGLEVTIVYTKRSGRIRLISARRAHDHERRAYRQAYPPDP